MNAIQDSKTDSDTPGESQPETGVSGDLKEVQATSKNSKTDSKACHEEQKPITAVQDDEDLGLDAEFITDDFVSIGMRDAVKQSEGEEEQDIDLKALETMVEEIENGNELP